MENITISTKQAELLYHFGRSRLLQMVPRAERENFYFDQECGMRKVDPQVYDALQFLHNALVEAGV